MVSRAVTLPVGIIGERLPERERMWTRQHRQRSQPFRVAVGDGPGDGAAPVVADEVERGAGGARVGDGDDVLDEAIEVVGGTVGRVGPRTGGVPALVDGHGVVPGRHQRRQLCPPRVPALREAVEQQHERTAVGTCDIGGERPRGGGDHVVVAVE